MATATALTNIPLVAARLARQGELFTPTQTNPPVPVLYNKKEDPTSGTIETGVRAGNHSLRLRYDKAILQNKVVLQELQQKQQWYVNTAAVNIGYDQGTAASSDANYTLWATDGTTSPKHFKQWIVTHNKRIAKQNLEAICYKVAFDNTDYACTDAWEWRTSNLTWADATQAVTTYGQFDGQTYYADTKSRMKQILVSRHAPNIFIRTGVGHTTDVREMRARETLRLVIGAEAYEKFLKHGFVMARNSSSGRSYQLYPGYTQTYVYENGQIIDRLCVQLSGQFPPTDALIVRYLMALNNEARLWKLANKAGALAARCRNNNIIKIDNRPLTEIFSEVKKCAHLAQNLNLACGVTTMAA
jgi:hypothetical protein